MTTQSLGDRLAAIATPLKEGEPSQEPTVREFLSWIGAQRRGVWIVERLRSGLKGAGLITRPDFESAYIDAPIRFEPIPDPSPSQEGQEGESDEGDDAAGRPIFDDPTYRLSKLAAANSKPLAVKPDDALEVAVTQMLANDYSQLPVMTSEHSLKGLISWKTIGARLATGKKKGPVRDFMEAAVGVDGDASLFNVIGQIVRHDYVLVRGSDQRVTGIVTASDLSLQFRTLTEPFLLLSEIENHIRRIIGAHFDQEDLKAALDPDGPPRDVESVADLTFGEYVRLLQRPQQWERLKTSIDRGVFVERLDAVRRIRNDVMHFDPDGIPDSDLEVLRDFAKFLQTIKDIDAV